MAKVDVNRKAVSLGQEQHQKSLIKSQDHVQKYEGSLESTFRTYSSTTTPRGTLAPSPVRMYRVRVGKLGMGRCSQVSKSAFSLLSVAAQLP